MDTRISNECKITLRIDLIERPTKKITANFENKLNLSKWGDAQAPPLPWNTTFDNLLKYVGDYVENNHLYILSSLGDNHLWGRKIDNKRLIESDNRSTTSSKTIIIHKDNYDKFKTEQLIFIEKKTKRTKEKGYKSRKSKEYIEVTKGLLDIAVLVESKESTPPPNKKRTARNEPKSSPPTKTKKTKSIKMPREMTVNILNPVITENDPEKGVTYSSKATSVLDTFTFDLKDYISTKGKCVDYFCPQ